MSTIQLWNQPNQVEVKLFDAQAITAGATVTSSLVDTGQVGKQTGKIFLSVSSASSTSGTCTIAVNESPDGGTTFFSDALSSNVQTGNGQLSPVAFTVNSHNFQVMLTNSGGYTCTANLWVIMDAAAASELGPVT